MPTVNLITLGCPKNTVDSERMHRLLEINGYTVSDEAEGADVIIVNTCGFIEPAKEESIATVLDAVEYKVNGTCKGIIVTGCLAERYRFIVVFRINHIFLNGLLDGLLQVLFVQIGTTHKFKYLNSNKQISVKINYNILNEFSKTN